MTIVNVGFYNLSADTSDDTITLSGSSSVPNAHSVSGLGTQSCGWIFDNEGRVYKSDDAGAWPKSTQFQDGTEWNGSQDVPTDDYWIRFTEHSFSGDGTREYQSAGLGTWYKVSLGSSTDRAFGVTDVSGTGPTDFVVKVEIASDGAGSNIVATGYYSASAEQDD